MQLAHHVGRFMQLSGRALKDQKEHERAHAQHQVMAHWATQVATEVEHPNLPYPPPPYPALL